MLVTTVVNDGILIRQFKWVIQCKHKSLPGRSYNPGFIYHKTGIFLSDIVADTERQQRILMSIDEGLAQTVSLT